MILVLTTKLQVASFDKTRPLLQATTANEERNLQQNVNFCISTITVLKYVSILKIWTFGRHNDYIRKMYKVQNVHRRLVVLRYVLIIPGIKQNGFRLKTF